MSDLIGSSSEASKGAFQGILLVEGVLVSGERKPSRFTDSLYKSEPKDQAEVTLEDALILEMEEGETEPELKDDKFVFWMNYAVPGKDKPHQNTFFVKGFQKSAEELWKARGEEGKGWRDLIGSRVTLKRVEIVLFSRPSKENPEEKEEFTGTGYVFVETEDGASTDIKTHIADIIVGKVKSAAIRALLTDARGKQFPEYKAAVQSDSIETLLPNVYVDEDGKFQVTETVEE